MNINLTLSAAQNLIAQATDPAFTRPTNPDYLAVTAPRVYDPASDSSAHPYANALSLDGANNNTVVFVFLRPSLEDVNDDGVNQKIFYQRKTLAQALGATPANVTVATGANAGTVKADIASQLSLMASEFDFTTPFTGAPATVQIQSGSASLIYLSSTLTVNLTYA